MAEKKKEKKSAPKKVKDEKYSLYDLVKDYYLPLFLIKPALMSEGLYEQYLQEEELVEKGEKVNKSLTRAEFNKIITKFNKKEI